MYKKDVLLLLTDRWADWEASYAIAEVNSTSKYEVKTIAIDKETKKSIGGIRATIDYTISEYENFENLAMIIMTGGYSWAENSYDEIADFIKKVHDLDIPIAAICGATIFLAKHGFLNNIKHTGDEQEYFQNKLQTETKYTGQNKFVSAQIVSDNGFITANETAALEFALEIFRTLEIDSKEEINNWFDKFKNGIVN